MKGRHSISIKCKMVSDSFSWVLSGVYAPCDERLRVSLWEELGVVRETWQLPWCIGGDFNEVLRMHERSGTQRMTSGMRQFTEFVDKHELVDLPMSGARFSWQHGENSDRFSKIDRFLISLDFDLHFPSISSSVLGKPLSDHAPIKFVCDLSYWGPSPFRFEFMFLEDPNILVLMEKW